VSWFQREFLKLADEALSPKERGDLLKLAFTATLKGDNAGDSTDALYAQHLERMVAAQEARRNRPAE